MKILTLPILAVSLALATIAMADTTVTNSKVPAAKTQTVAPAKTETTKMDMNMACKKPMDKSMGCMHCGM